MNLSMPSRPDAAAIVVAAGQGTRAGGAVPKQFRPVGGVPMLLRALRPFLSHPDIGQVVVVLPADVVSSPPEWLAALAGERLLLTQGGETRMDSVLAGLGMLRPEPAVILVHDGARPFVEGAVIDAVLTEARAGRSAIAAVPVADTLKEASGTGAACRVRRTVPRDGLWRAQTPQAFPAGTLRAALAAARQAGIAATDEAAAVEARGGEVVLVLDRTTNIKVTTADDFVLADAMAGAR